MKVHFQTVFLEHTQSWNKLKALMKESNHLLAPPVDQLIYATDPI